MALSHNAKRHHSLPCYASFLFLSLLCFASLLLLLSSSFRSRNTNLVPKDHHTILQFQNRVTKNTATESLLCNYSDGFWIRSPDPVTPRYDNTCKEIFKGWNCISSHKSNGWDLLHWRWQPYGCDLPPFDPVQFLKRYRNTNIGFVGDSLNRNMFVSMVCALRRVAGEVRKWRPAGADRGFTFLRYNLTLAYHRTNLLVRYGRPSVVCLLYIRLGRKNQSGVGLISSNRAEFDGIVNADRWSASSKEGVLESLGYKQGYRVDVDVPEHTWAEAPTFHDILIFNTGHWWWPPAKFDPVQSPMLFFENNMPVIPPIPPVLGLDMALKNMILYVERKVGTHGIKYFRTQSPRHFEGGDWNQGGSCQRTQPLLPEQIEDLFASEKNATNMEARLVNQHLYKALKGSSFRILDITRMSELRADAHPSTAGGKKHEDCMHWCLPGVTDTWNDLLVAELENINS